MQVENFHKGMGKLSKFYSKIVTEDQTGIWFQKLKHLSNQQFEFAVDAVTSAERFFPTPVVVLEYASKARPDRKSKSPDMAAVLEPRRTDSQFVRECRAIASRINSEGLKGFELAEVMFDVDKRFPGKGMREEAIKVYNNYARKNALELMKAQSPENERSDVRKFQCANPSCSEIGTISSGVATNDASDLTWYCRKHFR